MSPEQKAALVAFAKREIDEQSLLRIFGGKRSAIPEIAKCLLAKALQERDGDALTYVRFLQSAFHLPPDPECPSDPIDQYHRLLVQEWHQEHEDIIGYLQDRKSPESIPYLVEAISLKPRLQYLEYDDYGSYYKKCLWALFAIGTKDAIAAIESCVMSPDPALQKEATYRLSKVKAHGL